MIHRRPRPHAHEFLGADLDDRDAGIIVEMGNHVVGHDKPMKLLAATGDCRTIAIKPPESTANP
jgi:hypothetical protein